MKKRIYGLTVFFGFLFALACIHAQQPGVGVGGSGGGGGSGCGATFTKNSLIKAKTTSTCGDSAVSDDGTTVTSTEPIAAPSFAAGTSPPSASVCDKNGTTPAGVVCLGEGSTVIGTLSGVGVMWFDASHFTHINNNATDSYVIQSNSLPSVGILHVAGSTNKTTGSLLVNADITTATIGASKLAPLTFDAQTDAATITWAIGSVINADASVTLGGNRTLNITNPVVGGNYVFKITQDGGAPRTLTPGTGCTWKVLGGDGGGTFDLSTTNGAIDILAFTYDGTNCLANIGKAYAAP